MVPQTRKNANNNNSDNAEGSGANPESNGTGLKVLMKNLVTMQAQIQEHLQRHNIEQASHHTQMMNALAGRRQNNNKVQHEVVNDDSNQDNEPNQNDAPPACQAARANEALIKCYN